MREYRLLWLVWFIWASWLFYKIFPDTVVIKFAGLLLAIFVPILIFYQTMMRKNRMKFFNHSPKASQNGKKSKVSASLAILSPETLPDAAGSKARVDEPKANSSVESAKSSLVANTMLVTGNLEGAGNIEIEGRIVGNIIAQRVRIAESGQVKGDIKAQYIIVNGRAEGKLHADTVTLQRDGIIEGTIFADELVIDKGGVFMGQSQKKSLSPADKPRGKVKAAESENKNAANPDAVQQNEAG